MSIKLRDNWPTSQTVIAFDPMFHKLMKSPMLKISGRESMRNFSALSHLFFGCCLFPGKQINNEVVLEVRHLVLIRSEAVNN